MRSFNILALTRYDRLAASSRLRFFQYADFLAGVDIHLTFQPFFGNDYVRLLVTDDFSRVKVMYSYLKRLLVMGHLTKFDAIWVEKELLPWLPAWIELAFIPQRIALVVDYDDAWFHRYDGHPSWVVRMLLGKKIDRIMARADTVVAGNEYLAQRARAAGARRIRLLPTVVDLNRYPRMNRDPTRVPLVVGWMGSPSTSVYLEPLFSVAEKLRLEHHVRFIAVGANPAHVEGTPFEAQPWTEDTECAQLGSFDIGIMPLPDQDWERGKCGYKLVQYMAGGLPVVASPVGINNQIVTHGETGFLANSTQDWYLALKTLLTDAIQRTRLGATGRTRVESSYCLSVTAPMLRDVLAEGISHQGR